MKTLQTIKEKILEEFEEEFIKAKMWEMVPNTPRKIMMSDVDAAKMFIDIKSFISEKIDEAVREIIKNIEGMKQNKSEKCFNCGGEGLPTQCMGGSDWEYKNGYNQAILDIQFHISEFLKP